MDFSVVGLHKETMRATGRHPKLPTVHITQLLTDPSPKRWTLLSQIDGNIKYAGAQCGNEFPLWIGMLKMQSTQNTFDRSRQVVLNPRPKYPHFSVALAIEKFRKITSVVVVLLAGQYDDIRNDRRLHVHLI